MSFIERHNGTQEKHWMTADKCSEIQCLVMQVYGR